MLLSDLIKFEGCQPAAPLRGETLINLRAANRQPSTNTKTKLDLTKAFLDFHKPLNASANIRKVSEYRKTFLHFFAIKMLFSIK